MPLYEFVCSDCGAETLLLKSLEWMEAMDWPRTMKCRACGGEARRRATKPVWRRGSQWHARMMDHDAGKPGRKG
jgi:putative FmdB family regulatory protein